MSINSNQTKNCVQNMIRLKKFDHNQQLKQYQIKISKNSIFLLFITSVYYYLLNFCMLIFKKLYQQMLKQMVKYLMICIFFIFYQKIKSLLNMDLPFVLNYTGFSELLKSPPWKKNKKNKVENIDSTAQKQVKTHPNQTLGFVAFRLHSLQNLKQEASSDIDSEEAERGEDSESDLENSKVQQNRQKKKQSENGRSRKGPYKKYTTDQKKQAIQLINSGKDIKTISKQFNIPRRNLLRWRKNGCERKEGGGRPSDFVMQQKLFEMILRKQVTTQKQIREYALTMTNFKKFKASKGWYVKFWRRFREYTAKTGRKEKDVELNIIKQQ